MKWTGTGMQGLVSTPADPWEDQIIPGKKALQVKCQLACLSQMGRGGCFTHFTTESAWDSSSEERCLQLPFSCWEGETLGHQEEDKTARCWQPVTLLDSPPLCDALA